MDKKTDKQRDEGCEVPVHVEDRRFWARAQGGEADEGPEDDSSPYPTFVKELEARLQAGEKRLDETLAAHRRVQAEFDEVRARLQRDVDGRVRRAKANLFRNLLEIADHMDLALQAAEKEPGGRERGDPLAQGIRLIHGQLLSALREEGVERLDVVGGLFDPEQSEAVGMVPVEDREQHDRVVTELRAGYRLGELVLRAAQVQVGRHPAGAAASSTPEPAPSEGTEPGR